MIETSQTMCRLSKHYEDASGRSVRASAGNRNMRFDGFAKAVGGSFIVDHDAKPGKAPSMHCHHSALIM